MTSEEMERAIAFVLQQQAKLVVQQSQTEDRLQRLEGSMGLMREAIVGTMGLVQQLAKRMDQLTERMDQLTERVDQLAGRMDQLTERVDSIGERLDAFIVVVERYITRGNGNGHKP